jgi:hypothetical protein
MRLGSSARRTIGQRVSKLGSLAMRSSYLRDIAVFSGTWDDFRVITLKPSNSKMKDPPK